MYTYRAQECKKRCESILKVRVVSCVTWCWAILMHIVERGFHVSNCGRCCSVVFHCKVVPVLSCIPYCGKILYTSTGASGNLYQMGRMVTPNSLRLIACISLKIPSLLLGNATHSQNYCRKIKVSATVLTFRLVILR